MPMGSQHVPCTWDLHMFSMPGADNGGGNDGPGGARAVANLARSRQFVQQRLSHALWQMRGGGTASDVRDTLELARGALNGHGHLSELAMAYDLIAWAAFMVGDQASYPPLRQAGRLVQDLLVISACAGGVALDAECVRKALCEALQRTVEADEACRLSQAFAQIVRMGQVDAEPDRVHRVYGVALPEDAAAEIRLACQACAAGTPRYMSKGQASRPGRPPKRNKRRGARARCGAAAAGM